MAELRIQGPGGAEIVSYRPARSGRSSVQTRSASRTSPFQTAGLGVDSLSALPGQDLEKFKAANNDLLYVIGKSDQARENLAKTTVTGRDDLVRVIAQTAHALLKGDAAKEFSEADLKAKPAIASLIVLNTGGIQDRLNQDSDFASKLARSTPAPEDHVFSLLADKAVALFDSSSPLNDKGFFQDHPKAAIYLLSHLDEVYQYTVPANADTNARTFKSQVDSPTSKSILDNYVSTAAANASGSGAYPKSFFADNVSVAEFVAAGDYITDQPRAGQFLKDHPQYNLRNKGLSDNFNASMIIRDVTASQAKTNLGEQSPLTFKFLSNNGGLAQLINEDKDLRTALQTSQSRQDLKVILGDSSEEKTSGVNELDKSFQSRYTKRNVVSIIA